MIAGNESGGRLLQGQRKSGVDGNSAALEVLVHLISFSAKRITWAAPTFRFPALGSRFWWVLIGIYEALAQSRPPWAMHFWQCQPSTRVPAFDSFKLPHGGTHTGSESSPDKLISSGTACTSRSSCRSCRDSDVCQNKKEQDWGTWMQEAQQAGRQICTSNLSCR